MAKQKQEAIEKLPTGGALARPAFVEKSTAGLEHLRTEDLKMPRLILAQALSPQLKRSDPSFINGLQNGDLFNDLTCEVYGPGPMDFAIIRAYPPHGIEFNGTEPGSGVKDMNVPVSDPRMQWRIDEKTGQSQTPLATLFYEYVIWLFGKNEPVALSLKSSGIKVAKRLNALAMMRQAPIYTGRYTLTTAEAKGAKGDYNIMAVNNSAIEDGDNLPGWVSEPQAVELKKLHEQFQKRELNVEREAGDDTFDTAAM